MRKSLYFRTFVALIAILFLLPTLAACGGNDLPPSETKDNGKTPEDIIKEVLKGFEVEFSEKKDTKYYCNCSKERVEKVLITLGEKELTDIINEDKKAELSCHFCDKVYNFTEEDLIALLKSAKGE